MVTESEYERIEGVFHDALGTYFELVVCNGIAAELVLAQPPLEVAQYESKMLGCIEELKRAADKRWATLTEELRLIGASGPAAVENLLGRPQLRDVTVVAAVHTAAEYAGGNAGDVRIDLTDGSSLPVSCKTDKSGKVALADLGQTSIERAAQGLYDVSPDDLEQLARQKLGKTLAEVKESYYTASHLWRPMMIDQLGIVDAEINDFGSARATNVEGVRRMFGRVKDSIHGNDGALLLVVSRKDGSIGTGTSMDRINPSTIDPKEVSFTPGKPKSGKPVGTTLGVKWRAPGSKSFATAFDHQVKHQRGAKASEAFRDVTTRVKT